MRGPDLRPVAQFGDVAIRPVLDPLPHDPRRDRFGQAVDLPEAQAQRDMPVEPTLVRKGITRRRGGAERRRRIFAHRGTEARRRNICGGAAIGFITDG